MFTSIHPGVSAHSQSERLFYSVSLSLSPISLPGGFRLTGLCETCVRKDEPDPAAFLFTFEIEHLGKSLPRPAAFDLGKGFLLSNTLDAMGLAMDDPLCESVASVLSDQRDRVFEELTNLLESRQDALGDFHSSFRICEDFDSLSQIHSNLPFQYIKIATDRCQIRALETKDAVFFYEHVDCEVTRYSVGWEPPNSLEELEKEFSADIQLMLRRQKIALVAFDNDESFLGGIQLVPCGEGPVQFEIDRFWIIREKQGMGYGRELLQAFLEWLGHETDIREVLYSYTEGNEPSRRLVEKLHPVREFIVPMTKGSKSVITHNFVIPIGGQ
jgi:RimJ/RimL family protein N-acetyltransferase